MSGWLVWGLRQQINKLFHCFAVLAVIDIRDYSSRWLLVKFFFLRLSLEKLQRRHWIDLIYWELMFFVDWGDPFSTTRFQVKLKYLWCHPESEEGNDREGESRNSQNLWRKADMVLYLGLKWQSKYKSLCFYVYRSFFRFHFRGVSDFFRVAFVKAIFRKR